MRAVLFDLDGTIVDSAPDIHAALAAAMVANRLPAPTLAETTSWIGGGVNKLVERALAREPERAAGVVAAFREAYAAAPAVRTRVYDGMGDVLDHVLGHLQVPIAIVTNKPHDLAVAIAGAVLGRWRFAVIDGQQPGLPLKPSGEPALRAARAIGVEPSSCLFVGDSDVDVLCARAAGMRVIGAAWGYRPREELMAADAVADHPRALLALM